MRDDGTTTAPAAPRAVGWVALILAIGTGLYGTFFWATIDGGPPANAFPPAAKIIRDAYQPNDLILVVPFYATRVFEELGDLSAVAVRDPLAEDLDRHPRIWVFGLFGEGTTLAAKLGALGMVPADSWTPADGITVHLFDNPTASAVTYDFLAHLKDAKVFHEKGSEKIKCDTWTTGRGGAGQWQCPKDKDWFYVAPEYHQMGDHQRFCLWAHPPSEGRLVVRYPGVPLTGRIYGRAGHTLNGSLNARAPVELDVAIDHQPPQRFSFPLKAYDEPFIVRTATTGTATVTFAVSTTDAGVNHFCFRADLRTSGPKK